MPHLYKFRKGWQSEGLASFLLSHFAFIAKPSTVADDVGSDFYCTLFKKDTAGSNHYLIPRNSFAIQIKSSTTSIDLSDKAEFLHQLEVPFFVGVVDRHNMRLAIYSGRGLDLLFAMKGIPRKLVIKLVPSIQNKTYYEIVDEQQKEYNLNFPLITDINGTDVDAQGDQFYSAMAAECSMIHENISSRRRGEFILRFGPDDLRIFAGPGSAQTFRQNFFWRLAEVFYNLEWIYLNKTPQFSKAEFEQYADCWSKLRPHAPDPEKALVDDICEKVRTKF